MKTLLKFFLLVLVVIQYSSCKKNTSQYVYQVKDQELYQSASQKTNLKSTAQFITIAYNDLFNAAITTSELNKLNIDLQSFGDKGLVQDMAVKTLMNRSGVQITSNDTMRADIPTFVQQSYLRFYNRKPTDFEAWKMQNLIQTNTDITPQMVYYSMMTSDEYKYY